MRSSYRRHRLTLDRWGIALTIAGELQGSSRDAWRVHHDACAARMFDDALRAGIVGRTEVHTASSPTSCRRRCRARGGSGVPASCLTRCWPGVPPGRMRPGACATTSTT